MDFLKKHYEKVLLGVVLAGLAVGAALLPWMISAERNSLKEMADAIINRPVKELQPPTNLLARAADVLQRAAAPAVLDFSSENNLFNPVQWQKLPDGRMVKGANRSELEALTVTKMTPLYTILTLETVITNDAGARYMIGVAREAAPRPGDRVKRTAGAAFNEKKEKENFIIREVKGAAAAPTELVLELLDSSVRGTVAKGKPFKHVDGFMADLKYSNPPENRSWPNQRVGSRLRIGAEDYIVVAISTNEVVLSAPSGKKTSRLYKPNP